MEGSGVSGGKDRAEAVRQGRKIMTTTLLPCCSVDSVTGTDEVDVRNAAVSNVVSVGSAGKVCVCVSNEQNILHLQMINYLY